LDGKTIQLAYALRILRLLLPVTTRACRIWASFATRSTLIEPEPMLVPCSSVRLLICRRLASFSDYRNDEDFDHVILELGRKALVAYGEQLAEN
jgi:hypothetical protein